MFLVVHGPNLNLLGEREPEIYGTTTLADIDDKLQRQAKAADVALKTFQSNHEGELIDHLQSNRTAEGLIINPAALTHYSLSLRDALAAMKMPIVEVHLSNIFKRESFRRNSVTAEVALGSISGFGWRSYTAALDILIALRKESGS